MLDLSKINLEEALELADHVVIYHMSDNKQAAYTTQITVKNINENVDCQLIELPADIWCRHLFPVETNRTLLYYQPTPDTPFKDCKFVKYIITVSIYV